VTDRWAWLQRIGLRDVLLALVLFGWSMVGSHAAAQNDQDWSRPLDAVAYALIAVATLALILRRVSPEATVVLSGTALTGYLAMGFPFGPIMLTAPFVVYAMTSQRPFKRGIAVSGGYFLATLLGATVLYLEWGEGAIDLSYYTWSSAWLAVLAASAAIGAAVRVRRVSQAGVRAEQARRAVSEEQLRTAQELHDVVGHGLAVIAMQAGIALHVLDRNPGKARESLEAIRDTSREALDGLRAELAILRAPDAQEAPRRPGPGLAEIDVLVDRIRAGGIAVDLRVDDAGADPLPADVDQAAYRILQESLTNVLRHAETDAASVDVAREDGSVVIVVADRGAGGPTGHPADRPGSGIRGMRTRAERLGGTLEAGPRPGGGFAVRARLPVPDVPGSSP
jgi:signal transduction histidine kinase